MIFYHEDLNHFRLKDSNIEYEDISSFLKTCEISFINEPTRFRKSFKIFLKNKAYAISPLIDIRYKMTITAKNNNTLICMQIGNTARFHSDLLKVMHMYNKNRELQVIFIVPEKPNGNRAFFEKSVTEIKLYNNIITLPIRVISINHE